ncbi:P-loop containing nucleoside triphosphate hydrolase protein [Lentinula aciculospora]|uniref:P-loop containing nucleoside triphosphate hydrolase protein n=1 Tax=Lentinula aciculospora TaxID=153920 RepID=A0A9W9AM83_9AGAR|nr:P-loop containing nucleoside triphosphate hydrolase protein [Lentinula aciculospora]
MESPGGNNALNRSMQGLWRKNKINLNSSSNLSTTATTEESVSTPVQHQNNGQNTPPEPIPAAQKGTAASNVAVNGKRKIRSSRTTDSESKRQKVASTSTTSKSTKDYTPPSTRLSDLGGVDACIEKMLEYIAMPLCHPEIYLHTGIQPPRGVLLHGPPGCGKTMLANAMAGELGVPFINISAPSIVSGMSGESEKTLRDAFEEAKRLAPSLLFIDEIDAVTPKRESAQREMERRIVAQFLTCMDELSWEKTENKPVLVIGATNRPDSLDAALRRAGRFDHEISIGVPDDEAREKILRVLSSKLRLEGNFDFTALAKATPGYVGADLSSLTAAAGINAVKRIFKELGDLPVASNVVGDTATTRTADVTTIAAASAEERVVVEVEMLSTDDVNEAMMQIDVDLSARNSADTRPETDLSQVIETAPSASIPMALPSSFPASPLSFPLSVGPIARFLNAHPDSLTPSQLSPLCITSSDFTLALKQVQPSSKREGFATVPDVTWSDVGALHDLRQELNMAIVQPIKHPDLFKGVGIEAACGVLLWGPPGCGKTLLAKAVANESRANFISVKGPELLNKYVGESERAVRQVFARARASSPCVVFFDELDALVPRRDDSLSESSSRVVNTLLTELDGLDARKSVYVIAATNRPDIIDPAMVRPGRLDKLLYVDLPTRDERVEIVRTLVRGVPLGSGTSGSAGAGGGEGTRGLALETIEHFIRGEKCDGYSGADLKALVREAGVIALKRTLGLLDELGVMSDLVAHADTSLQRPTPSIVFVQDTDFVNAQEKVYPSVSVVQRRKYETLRSKLSGLPVKGGVARIKAEEKEEEENAE